MPTWGWAGYFMSESLKDRIQEDLKTAMRAKDKPRLGVIRLIMAAIQQKEIDERISLDNTQILAVLEKMIKQRRDSITHYQQGSRQDLVDQEAFEIEVIQTYLPQPFSEAELRELIEAVMKESGATSAKDLGKVMKLLKLRVQGRADMQQLSRQIKQRLGA